MFSPNTDKTNVNRGSRRDLYLALMGACLFVAGCSTAQKVETERPTPPSASKPTEPRSSQSAEQNHAVSDSLLPKFERADEETKRLPPKAFKNLPPDVMQELERRGCTIPQPYTDQGQGNVITGRFTAPGQMDLAVLCSRERLSSILVFRKSSIADVAELASAPDLNYLQEVGGGRIGYSRALGVANSEYIKAHYDAYGSLKPPPLDHEGIDDAFLEKASTVWYWYEGQWLQLTGSD